MNEKDRLTELIRASLMKHVGKSCSLAENIVADLIANGVTMAPQWISVEERLPEGDNRVLVSCRTKKGVQSCNLAYYWNGTWHGQGSMSGVTHWMPLPDPPEDLS